MGTGKMQNYLNLQLPSEGDVP